VLVVDWPSRDVPDALVRGGFTVVVHGGPGAEDYAAYELDGGDVVVRPAGPAPERVDVVYSHRPVEELPGIVKTALALGAGTIWLQSGLADDGSKDATGCWMPDGESRRARAIVESAGLAYFDQPYIADAVRGLDAGT
jgi:predicted CoA-binding protein